MSQRPATLPEILQEQARRRPKSVLLLCDDLSLTYGEFNREVHRVANAFLRSGVKRGDKIALLLDN